MHSLSRLSLTLLCGLTACAAPKLDPILTPDWSPKTRGQESATSAELPPRKKDAYPLDLQTLLRLAGDKPLQIKLAMARAQRAKAQESQAWSQWLPALRPRLAFHRHDGLTQDTGGTFLDVSKHRVIAASGVDIILNPADAMYQSIAAAQRSRAGMLGIRQAQNMNLGYAIDLYYDLLQAQANLAISNRAEEHAAELLAIEESRERQGVGLPAQVLRAKAFLASTQGKVARRQADTTVANAKLRSLLLLPQGAEVVPVQDKIVAISFSESQASLERLLVYALQHRPDLQGARALREASQTERSQADWSWLMPQVRLGAEYGGLGRRLDSLQDSEDYVAAVEWELSFSRASQAQIADARFEEAQLQVRIVKQQIITELQTAKARLEASSASMQAAEQELIAAAAAALLVDKRHQQGAALLLEVMDAQRSHMQASIGLVSAICNHNRAQFELQRVIGSKGREAE